jgi:outer membrane protein TolC
MKTNLLFFCIIILLSNSISLAAETDQEQQVILPIQQLTLPECISIALSKTPEMNIAVADVSQKEETLEGLKKDRYPVLSFDYLYTKYYNTQYRGNLGNIIPEEDSYGYGVTLQQPLYVGKKIVTSVEIGKLDMQSSLLAREATVDSVILKTYEAYYSLLKTEKLAEVATLALQNMRSHLKDAKAFFDAGLIPKNDLLISELELAQGQQDLLKSANTKLLAQSILNIILQRNPAAPLQVVDNLVYDTPRTIVWEEVKELALQQRPELKQYKLLVEISERNKILTRAPFLPSVILSATYRKQGNSLVADTNPLGPTEVGTAEAMATWKFWSWGQKRNKISAAERQIEKAKESLRQLQENIVLETRQAFLAADETQKNISVTEKAIEQAEENYRIVNGRFQAQLATSTEVLDAQTLLTRARSNYYNALYNYNIAMAYLDRATGSLGISPQ